MMVPDAVTTDQGEEVITMTAPNGNLRTGSASQESSPVGGSAFQAMADAINGAADLLPPTHPDGPHRMRDINPPVSQHMVQMPCFVEPIFTLAGDGVSRLPRGVTTR